jgi:hypothetical protein
MTEKKERDPKERDEKGKLVSGHEIRKTSGAWLFLKSGNRIPSVRGKRRLQKHLNDLRTRLMEVVPNSSDPRREIIIFQVLKSEFFLRLIMEYLNRAGILNPIAFREGRLEVQGALTSCVSFMNAQLRSLQALGLDSAQAQKVLTPYEIVQEEEKPK